MQSVAMKGKSI